jgi:4-hydroxybenzoate polyprenyltransferase
MYNTKGKKTGLLGNFLVSACVAIPFIYGSFLFSQEYNFNSIFYALIAFLSNTGREINKGIADKIGDNIGGINTVAVRYGEKTAAYSASFFFISAILLSVIPPAYKLVTFFYIPFVILTDLGFIISSIMLIHDQSKENAKKIKKIVLISMIFGLLAFIAGIENN